MCRPKITNNPNLTAGQEGILKDAHKILMSKKEFKLAQDLKDYIKGENKQ